MGPNEVKITKVYTVEVGEFSAQHDSTPNWREMVAPKHNVGAAFALRIEAEAGNALGNSPKTFNLYIQPVCLTNPGAVMGFWTNLRLIPGDPGAIGGAFNATEWEYDAAGDKYTKSWNIPFSRPQGPGNIFPGFQTPQVYQYYVTLVDAVGSAFASTLASAPFILL
jgi:hypothetical protein